MSKLDNQGSPKKDRGLLIINADDWGGWPTATDSTLACFAKGRITSVSAMVYMQDSARGASLAKENGIDAGLHVNFTQAFSAAHCPPALVRDQQKISRFLKFRRSALILYHPLLRAHFRRVYQFQYDEFLRIYGKPPTHIDGHQHMHLSTNMLIDGIIPRATKIRRSFSFNHGQKSRINRAYRQLVYLWIKSRYQVPQHFFALSQNLDPHSLSHLTALARTDTVELMMHPEIRAEREMLLSDEFAAFIRSVRVGSYSLL